MYIGSSNYKLIRREETPAYNYSFKTNPKVKATQTNLLEKDTINLYVGASQLDDYIS